jgi:hypothetical protein
MYEWRSGDIRLSLERSSFVTAGLGYQGWPSADVLARLIREGVVDILGHDVLELGCGIGIVGLVSAICGARSVVMTDYHAVVLETARRNAARNKVADKVAVCRLDWRHHLPADGALTGISAEEEYQYEQGSDLPSHGQGCACAPGPVRYSRILASYVYTSLFFKSDADPLRAF